MAVLGQDDGGDDHRDLADPERVEDLGLRYEGALVLPFRILRGPDTDVGEPGPRPRSQRRNDGKNAAAGVDLMSRESQNGEVDQGQHRGKENCSFHGPGRRPELGWFLHGRRRARQGRAKEGNEATDVAVGKCSFAA